jgi:branched-chain amino acid transport system permease protein
VTVDDEALAAGRTSTSAPGGATAAPAGLTARRPVGLVRLLLRPGVPAHAFMAVVLLLAAGWAASADPFVLLVGQSCAVYAIAALGQWLLLGRAGQIAISGAAFMAIGAFTTGLLADTPLEPFPIPLLVSALLGWVVGLVSGLPGLRFRGLYLLLASVALQFIVSGLARNYQLEHAPAGLFVPPLTIGGTDLSIGRPLYLTLLVVLAVVIVVMWAVERTGVGLAWRALKESEVAAAISGVDVTRWKLYAFALSGAITAVAGSLFSYVVGLAENETYSIWLSISLLTMIFIGGVQSRLGVLIGAVVITSLPYVLQEHASDWLDALGLTASWYTENVSQVNAGLFSLVFLLVVLFSPRGIEGLVVGAERLVRRVTRRTRTDRDAQGEDT